MNIFNCLFSKNNGVTKNYELLRTNLEFLEKKSNKVIVVTSTIQGEGKSSVASNYAKSEAEIGKKVLLIDCDSLKPQIHKCFNLKIKEELLDIILNKKKIEDVILKNVIKNLDILPLKNRKNNIIDTIFIKNIEYTLKELKNNYDVIILDTEPLMVSINALLLSELADGILFVVGYNMVSKKELRYSKTLIKNSKSNIYGVVINKVSKYEYFFGNYSRY